MTNLGTALLELDDGRGLGTTCEHVEAALVGAPAGLFVGLAAAVVYHLLRRRRTAVVLSVLGAVAGAVVALVVVDLLLYPLATNYLPISVCPY